MSDFRRSRAVPPQPQSNATMEILLLSIGHTNQCITGRKMALTNLRGSLSFDRWRRWSFVHQHPPHRSHTNDANDATTIGILLPSIGTYHRMYHRPNDGIHKAPSSILRSSVAMIMIVIVCVSTINIGLTAATNDATIILPSIGTYHRMYHRPNDSILWSFVFYLPSLSLLPFDRWQQRWLFGIYIAADRGSTKIERWVCHRKDGTWP